jgi:Ni,Fe-hydrogenase III small subunit
VVLRCGVAPVSYPPDAQLLVINGVTWFGRAVGKNVVFTSVDRTVPIEITVPANKGNPSDPIATLSIPIGRNVPVAPSPHPSASR